MYKSGRIGTCPTDEGLLRLTLLFPKKMLYSAYYSSLCVSTSGVCGILQRIKARSVTKIRLNLQQIRILHHQATIYIYIWDGCHWALFIQIIKVLSLCLNWFCALIFASKEWANIPRRWIPGSGESVKIPSRPYLLLLSSVKTRFRAKTKSFRIKEKSHE